MRDRSIRIEVEIRPIGLFLVGDSAPIDIFADIQFTKIRKADKRKDNGEYIIYGTSFKGWLRSAFTRFAHILSMTTCLTESNPEKCDTCRIFGASGIDGILYVSNLHPVKAIRSSIITHVSLNDETLTAREGALYSAEYIHPGELFKGYLEIKMIHDNKELIRYLKAVLVGLAALRTDRAGRGGLIDVRIVNAEEIIKRVETDEETKTLLSSLKEWGWDLDYL